MRAAGILARAGARLERLGERDRRALLLGAAILVPVLLWLAAVRPYLGALEAGRDRLASERALLAREEGLLAAADELPLRLAQAEAGTLAGANRLVPASNRPLAEAALTGALEEVAAFSRVLLEDIRGLEVPEPDTPPGIVPVQVVVQGESDVAGLTAFLHRVEASPLLMRVRELEVTPRVGGRGRNDDGPAPEEMGVVAFSMIVEAYANESIDNLDGSS